MPIKERTYGRGCPYGCDLPQDTKADRRRCCPCKSFFTLYPHLASEFDFSKNKIDPLTIPPKSHKKLWWLCPKKNCNKNYAHEFEATVADRTRGQSNCTMCSGRKVCLCNSFYQNHSNLMKEWSDKIP